MANALDSLLQSAVDDHRRGEMTAALEKYRVVLAERPDDWNAVYLEGTVLLQLERFEEAIAVLQRVADHRPGVADVHNNIGVAHQALGDWERTVRSYEAAIQAQPDYHLPHFNLGRLHADRDHFADAEAHLRRAVALKPDMAEHSLRLAELLGRQGQWVEAEKVLREGAAAQPEDLDLQVNRAYALLKLERLEKAAEVYRGILVKRPEYHQIHNNLAFVRDRQGHLSEALEAAQRAIALRPDYAEGFNNLGSILRSLHRLDEACDAFRQATALQPGFALAEFNLGATHLLAGDYSQGWPGYSRHADVAGKQAPGSVATKWQGEPISGKRLLVYDEQGFGDAIQFARFLRPCRDRSEAHVLLRCATPLVRLFSGLAGVDEIVRNSEPLPQFDFHIPLADLAGLLGVTLERGLVGVPYLYAISDSASPALELVRASATPGLRVGLVWQGNRQQTLDVVRSCPLEKLLPLLQIPGVIFFSLQTDKTEREQIRDMGLEDRLIDVGKLLTDFADTAAVLADLDILVSVDTSVAHLAGAMGRPCWTLLCHTPDWRWHLDRSDSPWYPSMRLFRQPRWGDWDTVVAVVSAELSRQVARSG